MEEPIDPGKPSLGRRLRVEVHAAWLAARDPRCPWHARALGLLVTAYAFSPIDLIPDFIPVLGLLDDALIVPAGLWLFARMLPAGLLDECREKAAAAAERPGSAAGAALVLLVWIASGLLVLHLLGFRFDLGPWPRHSAGGGGLHG